MVDLPPGDEHAPAKTEKALEPVNNANQLGALFAGLRVYAQQIGVIGLLLLCLSVLITGYLAFATRSQERCGVPKDLNVVGLRPDPQKPRILRVQPVDFEFHKKVCLIIDSAVSPVILAKLQDELRAAESSAAPDRSATRAGTVAPARGAAVAGSPVTGSPAEAGSRVQSAQERLQEAQKALQEFTRGVVYKLYINGQPSTLTAHVEGRPDPQALSFSVQPEDDAQSERGSYWRNILAGPNQHGRVAIEIGLGPEDGVAPVATAPVRDAAEGATAEISFLLFTPVVMWTALAGMACVLLGIAGLAHDTALLREGRTAETAFSLSRVQMAFWFVLTSSGFLYIWLVTGEYKNVFPPALFVLTGISGATAAAAQILEGPSAVAPMSAGFFRDLCGAWEGGQLQLHRLQVLVWTTVLGVIFIWNIVAKLELTGFDTNLLILAGVANGVYLTLRPNENR